MVFATRLFSPFMFMCTPLGVKLCILHISLDQIHALIFSNLCICCVCSPVHVMLGLKVDFHTLHGTSNIKIVHVQEVRTMYDFKDINESCKSLTYSLGY